MQGASLLSAMERHKLASNSATMTPVAGAARLWVPIALVSGLEARTGCARHMCPLCQSPWFCLRDKPILVTKACWEPGEEEENEEPGSAAQPEWLPQQLPPAVWATTKQTVATLLDLVPQLCSVTHGHIPWDAVLDQHSAPSSAVLQG